MTSARKLDILLLYVLPNGAAGTIHDHVDAFSAFSRHRVHRFNNLTAIYGTLEGRLPTLPGDIDLALYDAVVIHYSNYLLSDEHLDAEAREKLRAYRGLKVLFLQDEYRQIDAISGKIRDLGINLLFTCVPESEVEKVYPSAKLPGLRKVSTLTGFVPPALLKRPVPPIGRRLIDVGYRGRPTAYWLGRLGAEKWQIVPRFLHFTRGSGLRCDISFLEEERIYGRAWLRFVASCRTMLGVESGASVFDFTGELQAATDRFVAANPGATFEEAQRRLLTEHDGRIRLNQISPRSFEAAALRTAMVLYEGEYSGVLVPERHYVPLRKDFSNIDEVVTAIRDVPRLQAMVDRTYREVALDERYSYRRFIERFDAELDQILFSATWQKAREEGGPAARRRLARTRIARQLIVFRAIALHRALSIAHLLYVRSLPETLRVKIRPHIRRLISRRST